MPLGSIMKAKSSDIAKSRQNALAQIRNFLSVDDVDGQFANRVGGYHSSDKFIVTWTGNYQGMAVEYKIEKTDAFYKRMSGNACVYGVANLFLEKQLGGYSSIERGLIEVGLKLCKGKKEKTDFFNEFAPKYNEKILEAKRKKMEDL